MWAMGRGSRLTLEAVRERKEKERSQDMRINEQTDLVRSSCLE